MLLKILKTILISFFSLNLISLESQNLKCDYDFEFEPDRNICVKDLRDNKNRKQGLMNTEKLSQNHQVNFIWNNERKIRCMWMKDTSIPLDILFIDESKIVLEKGKPFSTKKISEYFFDVNRYNHSSFFIKSSSSILASPDDDANFCSLYNWNDIWF